MKSWEVEEMMRNEGFREGFDEGFNDGFNDGFNRGTEKLNQLNLLLIRSNRIADIEKAALDTSYRNLLLKEYNL